MNGDNYNYYDAAGNLVLNQKKSDGGRTYMPDVSGGIKGKFGDYEVGASSATTSPTNRSTSASGSVANIGMFGSPSWACMPTARTTPTSTMTLQRHRRPVCNVTETVYVAKELQWWDDDSWRVIGNVGWNVAPGFWFWSKPPTATATPSATKSRPA